MRQLLCSPEPPSWTTAEFFPSCFSSDKSASPVAASTMNLASWLPSRDRFSILPMPRLYDTGVYGQGTIAGNIQTETLPMWPPGNGPGAAIGASLRRFATLAGCALRGAVVATRSLAAILLGQRLLVEPIGPPPGGLRIGRPLLDGRLLHERCPGAAMKEVVPDIFTGGHGLHEGRAAAARKPSKALVRWRIPSPRAGAMAAASCEPS